MVVQRKLFLGARLKRLRRDRGLNQSQMADQLGISGSYLNHLERNQRPVTAGILLRLAEAFDVDVKSFAAEGGEGGGATQLGEIFSDPMLADLGVSRYELVELAEAKLGGERVSVDAVREAARPMFDAQDGDRIDTVVLACTHFPLLEDELREAFPNIRYVHGGDGIARRIAWLTRDQSWPETASPGLMLFTSAARTPSLAALARFGIGEIKTL